MVDAVIPESTDVTGGRREDQQRALTSLRLWRLLEDWESMGVIRWVDKRLWVAFCPSGADALSDEDRWW